MRKILGLLAVLTAMGCGPDSINQLCGAGDTCPDKQVCAESGDGTRRCFQNGSIPDLKPATQPDMGLSSSTPGKTSMELSPTSVRSPASTMWRSWRPSGGEATNVPGVLPAFMFRPTKSVPS